MVTDLNGEIGADSELGVFADDTRFVSYYAVFASGEPWLRLTACTTTYYAARIHLINRAFATEEQEVQEGTLALVISRSLGEGAARRVARRAHLRVLVAGVTLARFLRSRNGRWSVRQRASCTRRRWRPGRVLGPTSRATWRDARGVKNTSTAWSTRGPLLLRSRSLSRLRRWRADSNGLRWERIREALTSVGAWQRAALAGVAGLVLSVLLSLLVPYQRMVALCEAIAPGALPTPAAYLVAGLLYGLVPMLIGSVLETRGSRRLGVVGAIEAAGLFMLVLVPYVLLRCAEFAPPLLAGFITGIGLGAFAGSLAAIGLTRREAWVLLPVLGAFLLLAAYRYWTMRRRTR